MRRILFLLLWWGSAQAQLLTGTVIDEAGQPVPYANVGLVRDKRGTVSDTLGRFRLDVSQAGGDSLRVSSLGYRTWQGPVAKLGQSPTIRLAENPIQIRPVTIRSREPKVRRVGNKGHEGTNIFFGGSSLGTELSTRMKLSRPSEVQTVHLYLAENRQPIKARIHFYPVVDGLPGQQPLYPPIVVTLPKGRQRFDVDVRHLDLAFDDDIFVGVEVIEADDPSLLPNAGFEGGVYSGPTYMRKTHLNPWERVYDWIFVFGVGFELTVLQ